MFKCSKNKLWLENPVNLLCDYKFIPLEGMNYTDQMNAISRLILIIFITMLIIGFKESFIFLFFSLLFIIIIYYMQINKMKERFETTSSCQQRKIIPTVQQQYHVKPKPYMYKNNATFNGNFKTPSDTFWCNDSINIDSLDSVEPPYLKKELIENNPKFTKKGIINNQEYVSMNQKLVGTANPKTFIAPVITPPIADLQYWKTNNLIVPSIINSQSQIDNYQSGYEIMPTNTRENYLNKDDEQLYYHKKKEEDEKEREEEEETHYNKIPFIKQDTKKEQHIYNSINTNCGYNPKQLLVSNLPSNLPSNYIQQNPKMKQYNENLFTTIIQPGVYSRNEVNEPINSNIGISFQQQFEPLTKSIDEFGNIIYIEHDPNSFVPKPKNSKINLNPTEYNVYDPRFTGYGTGYRGYTDDLLGQPKFYYNDVDAIRMPNYIVRSNIDNQKFADSYGPIEDGNQFGNNNTENIRELANQAFLDNALDFRTDLQERLMRKNNARSWQNKLYPINTGGQRNLGGMKI